MKISCFLPALAIMHATAFAVDAKSQRVPEFTMSFSALPAQVDPLDWRSLDRWFLLLHSFSNLIQWDELQFIRPSIADKWSVNTSRTVLDFHISKNAKFCDGTKISPADVVFSLRRYVSKQSEENPLKQVISGAINYRNAWDELKGIQVANDETVRIKLDRPFEWIWTFLMLPQSGAIIPKAWVDRNTGMLKLGAPTSGAYCISEHNSSSIHLRMNPHLQTKNSLAPLNVAMIKHASPQTAVEMFSRGETDVLIATEPALYDELRAKHSNLVEPIGQRTTIEKFHRTGVFAVNDRIFKQTGKHAKEIFDSVFSVSDDRNLFLSPLLFWSNSFFPVGSSGFRKENFKVSENKLNKFCSSNCAS